ncbi:COG0325 Predicted enzyme with a TIM-barrel fold [Candidatus Nanopelagicaceae bacterium]
MTSRSEELARNLNLVNEEIASYSPTLIVVTKTYPVSDVEILYKLGVRNFGENRSSEGEEKAAVVDALWNYQGAIQSKKIREILGWADCIHSLDQQGHAEKIDRILQEDGRNVDAFLQLSLDGDPERGGLIESDLFALAAKISEFPSISLLGLMSVPPVEMAPEKAFATIKSIHQRFTSEFPRSPYLSAGMSGDYLIALDHGATHIRVGSKILGSREYH